MSTSLPYYQPDGVPPDDTKSESPPACEPVTTTAPHSLTNREDDKLKWDIGGALVEMFKKLRELDRVQESHRRFHEELREKRDRNNQRMRDVRNDRKELERNIYRLQKDYLTTNHSSHVLVEQLFCSSKSVRRRLQSNSKLTQSI